MSVIVPPPRKSGTRGKLTQVTTNSFEITKLPHLSYAVYDAISFKVATKRGGPPREPLISQIIDRLQTRIEPQKFNPQAIFDGSKGLYSSHQIQFSNGLDSGIFEVDMSDDSPSAHSTFIVRIQLVAKVRPSDLLDIIRGKVNPSIASPAIQLINILLRQVLVKKYAHDKRSIYLPENRQALLKTAPGKRFATGDAHWSPLELWRGYFQSVRPSFERMFINVDVTAAVMYHSDAKTLTDLAARFIGTKDFRRLDALGVDRQHSTIWNSLKDFLKGLRVKVGTRNNGLPRVVDIRALQAQAGITEFYKDDELMTVAEYFRRFKGIKLRFPYHPGILIKRGDIELVIPFEECQVLPDQIYRKRLPAEYTSEILKFSTKRPDQRLQEIQRGFQIMNYQNSPYVAQSGMQVSSRPAEVQGRILDPPNLLFYCDPRTKFQQTKVVRDGKWDVMDIKLNRPLRVSAWSLISFASQGELGIQALTEIASDLRECCVTLGMEFPSYAPPISIAYGQQDINFLLKRTNDEAVDALNKWLAISNLPPSKLKRATIIIVILPTSAADIRREVKRFGDITHGVATQCLRRDKLPGSNQYYNNVALKINAKIGGINVIPQSAALNMFLKQPAMIVGADVTHPGPGELRPSVAGLVSSVDHAAIKYVAQCRPQGPRTEPIAELRVMMVGAIMNFLEYNAAGRVYPHRILYFRDGVSEGEFYNVAEFEVGQIKAAIDYVWAKLPKLSNEAKPRVTFIAVGKRHHVRFFPRLHEGDPKSRNCRPGLVVDSGITSPVLFDYYLQSQAGLLGTSRPSHYSVLYDEIGFDADSLQEISFALCHIYARATRSVSIPAPVYYADLVCSRAVFHLDPSLDYADDKSSMDVNFLEKWMDGFRPTESMHAKSMYFM